MIGRVIFGEIYLCSEFYGGAQRSLLDGVPYQNTSNAQLFIFPVKCWGNIGTFSRKAKPQSLFAKHHIAKFTRRMTKN